MEIKIQGIVGHEKETEFLNEVFRRGRIPHGFIFHGQKNAGKRYIASLFAKSVLCHDYGAIVNGAAVDKNSAVPLYSCGKCPSCASSERRTNPNFLIIEPVSGIIKLDSVNRLKSILALKPSFKTRRFVVIDDAPLMNKSAMNALLKILEEPPEDVCFILIASNINGLLPTIISRCSLLRFGGISGDALINAVKERRANGEDYNFEEDSLMVFSRIANGSFSDFERLLEGGYQGLRKYLINDILTPLFLHRKGVLEYFSLSDEFGRMIKEFHGRPSGAAEMLLLILRDIYIYFVTGRGELLYNSDILEEIRKFINEPGVTSAGLLGMIDKTVNYMDKMEYNLNKTIVTDSYFSGLLSSLKPA